jgi:hypothetical protein
MLNRTFAHVALTALLVLHAGIAPLALEVTATKNGEQVQTDLNTDMKVSAFSAAVQAAFNDLKARVDLFDARITALENWRATIDAWKASISATVAAMEPKVTYLYDSWRPYINSLVANLGNRVVALEARGSPTQVVWGGCTTMSVSHGSWATCPSHYVIMAVRSEGLTTGSKQWFGTFQCCQLRLQ